jgi:hypothetical protein
VREVLRAAGHPAVLVLATAGVVSVLSDTRAIDGLALVAIALVLVWDGARTATTPAGRAARMLTAARRALVRTPPGPVIAVGIGLALVVGGFERYSWPATLAVWPLVLAAVTLGWPAGSGTAARPAGRGALIWLGWAVLVALWELRSLLEQPTWMTSSWAHPTISVLLDPVLATYAGRVVAFGGWLACGWFLVRRAAE